MNIQTIKKIIILIILTLIMFMIKIAIKKKFIKSLHLLQYNQYFKFNINKQGFNATIMAYGQTGTGKTHTMEGFNYN